MTFGDDCACLGGGAVQHIADLCGWTPFVGLQIEYSLIQRTPERDLLPMAHTFDIGVTAWSPLAGGWLTGNTATSRALLLK